MRYGMLKCGVCEDTFFAVQEKDKGCRLLRCDGIVVLVERIGGTAQQCALCGYTTVGSKPSECSNTVAEAPFAGCGGTVFYEIPLEDFFK